MSKNKTLFSKLNGAGLRIGIVRARWNGEITSSLLDGCKQALLETGVKEKNVTVIDVPGCYEVPFAVKTLIKSKRKYDAVIALGCLIKGETMHFEYIAEAVSHGLMELNLNEKTPVVFGVLTCLNEKQALARSRGENNHGIGWGYTAVEMGLLKST